MIALCHSQGWSITAKETLSEPLIQPKLKCQLTYIATYTILHGCTDKTLLHKNLIMKRWNNELRDFLFD